MSAPGGQATVPSQAGQEDCRVRHVQGLRVRKSFTTIIRAIEGTRMRRTDATRSARLHRARPTGSSCWGRRSLNCQRQRVLWTTPNAHKPLIPLNKAILAFLMHLKALAILMAFCMPARLTMAAFSINQALKSAEAGKRSKRKQLEISWREQVFFLGCSAH